MLVQERGYDRAALNTAADTVAVVEKELQKRGRKRKFSQRHQYNEETKVVRYTVY